MVSSQHDSWTYIIEYRPMRVRGMTAPVHAGRIERAILVLRGHRVMLDADLAQLNVVETRALVQAVKRNFDRFPADFMFQLDLKEVEVLRSQSVTSNEPGRGGRRYAPYASPSKASPCSLPCSRARARSR